MAAPSLGGPVRVPGPGAARDGGRALQPAPVDRPVRGRPLQSPPDRRADADRRPDRAAQPPFPAGGATIDRLSGGARRSAAAPGAAAAVATGALVVALLLPLDEAVVLRAYVVVLGACALWLLAGLAREAHPALGAPHRARRGRPAGDGAPAELRRQPEPEPPHPGRLACQHGPPPSRPAGEDRSGSGCSIWNGEARKCWPV